MHVLLAVCQEFTAWIEHCKGWTFCAQWRLLGINLVHG